MNLQEALHWRIWTGRLAAFLCLLLLLAFLDAFLARFLEPLNNIVILPGETQEISGPVTGKIEHPQQLSYSSSSRELKVTFEEIKKGFWLGGLIWRGRLAVGSAIQPGKYTVIVPAAQTPASKSPTRFQVEVFKDQGSLDNNSKSRIRRLLGMNPWLVALFMLVLVLAAFGAVFLISQKIEPLLVLERKAEIYRVQKGEGVWLITFGLGRNQGLSPGSSLFLLDDKGQTIGQVTAQEVSENQAVAAAGMETKVRPGYYVSLG
jgi:hypothetical protein